MNTWLIILCIVASYLFLKNTDTLAVLILCFMTLFFNMIGDLIPAEYIPFYYIGAMITDSLIVYVLYRFINQTRLIGSLMVFSIGFIVINLAAFMLCMLRVSYTEFTLMYSAMYTLLLLIILANGEGYVLGSGTMDGRNSRFFGNSDPRDFALSPHKTEERH